MQSIEDQLGFGTFQKRQISVVSLGMVVAGLVEADIILHFADTNLFVIFFFGQFLGFLMLLTFPFKRKTILMIMSSILMFSCIYIPKIMVLFVGIAISMINPCCELLAGECSPEKHRGKTIIFVHICYAFGKSLSGFMALQFNLRLIMFFSLGTFLILTYRYVFDSYENLIYRDEIQEATEQIRIIAQINNLQKIDYTDEVYLVYNQHMQEQSETSFLQSLPIKLTIVFGLIAFFSNAQERVIQLTMAQVPKSFASYYIADLPCVIFAFLIIDLFSNLVMTSVGLQILSLIFILSVNIISIQQTMILLVVKIIHTVNGQFLSVICFRSYTHGNRLKGISIYKGLSKVANIIIPNYTSFVTQYYYLCLVSVQIIITIFSYLMLLI